MYFKTCANSLQCFSVFCKIFQMNWWKSSTTTALLNYPFRHPNREGKIYLRFYRQWSAFLPESAHLVTCVWQWCCDIQNNQGRGEGYNPQRFSSLVTLTESLIIPDVWNKQTTLTQSNLHVRPPPISNYRFNAKALNLSYISFTSNKSDTEKRTRKTGTQVFTQD